MSAVFRSLRRFDTAIHMRRPLLVASALLAATIAHAGAQTAGMGVSAIVLASCRVALMPASTPSAQGAVADVESRCTSPAPAATHVVRLAAKQPSAASVTSYGEQAAASRDSAHGTPAILYTLNY